MVLLLLLVLAGIAILVVAVSRPHFHRYVGSPLADTHLAVSVEASDRWKLNNPRNNVGHPAWAGLIFQPMPPTGLTRWWQEKVLRQDVREWQKVSLTIYMEHRAENQDMDTMERALKEMGSTTPCRRFRHPLGPAMETTMTEAAVPNRLIFIFPDDTPAHRKLFVTLIESADKSTSVFKTDISHMIESVRLEDK